MPGPTPVSSACSQASPKYTWTVTVTETPFWNHAKNQSFVQQSRNVCFYLFLKHSNTEVWGQVDSTSFSLARCDLLIWISRPSFFKLLKQLMNTRFLYTLNPLGILICIMPQKQGWHFSLTSIWMFSSKANSSWLDIFIYLIAGASRVLLLLNQWNIDWIPA